MEAARQKEMNVSITEDATISLTRAEGGATVVRLDAIAKEPARGRLWFPQDALMTAALRRVYWRRATESTGFFLRHKHAVKSL